jgi:hypothetical protein
MLPVRTLPLVSHRRLTVRVSELRRRAEGCRRPRSRAGATPRASREGERRACTSLVRWPWHGLPSSASRLLVGRARLSVGHTPRWTGPCQHCAGRPWAGLALEFLPVGLWIISLFSDYIQILANSKIHVGFVWTRKIMKQILLDRS